MCRYLLFGDSPILGGWDDFIDSFDDLHAACTEGNAITFSSHAGRMIYENEWWHVVDLESGQIVMTSEEMREELREGRLPAALTKTS